MASIDRAPSEDGDLPASLVEKASNPRRNNFGLLRVVLAGLVVLSHASEIADGDRRRELLTHLFGTVSFGVLAVDGFFLVSGFLIVKSWVSNPRLGSYLSKRVLRIYPGFAVASLLSVFVVGPLASKAHVSTSSLILPTVEHILILVRPLYPVALAFRHYSELNGAMWTISWEFLCYLLAAAMGLLGLTGRRWPWLVLAALGFAVTVYHDRHLVLENSAARFVALFASGATFYLYRDRIAYTKAGCVVASIGLVASLFFSVTAQLGLATFGAYLAFAFVFADIPFATHIGTRNDISYGLYLYAFPIQQLMLLYFPGVSLTGQFVATLGLSALMGYLSWNLVEKWAIRIKPRRTAFSKGAT